MNRRALFGVVALLGVVLVIAGLVLGYSRVQRLSVNCGSALGGSTDNAEVQDILGAMEGHGVGTDTADACSSALSDRKTLTWTLLAPGIVLLIVGAAGALVPVQAKRE